jgi:hypothetical protein
MPIKNRTCVCHATVKIACAMYLIFPVALLAYIGLKHENEVHHRTTMEDYMVQPPGFPSPPTSATAATRPRASPTGSGPMPSACRTSAASCSCITCPATSSSTAAARRLVGSVKAATTSGQHGGGGCDERAVQWRQPQRADAAVLGSSAVEHGVGIGEGWRRGGGEAQWKFFLKGRDGSTAHTMVLFPKS